MLGLWNVSTFRVIFLADISLWPTPKLSLMTPSNNLGLSNCNKLSTPTICASASSILNRYGKNEGQTCSERGASWVRSISRMDQHSWLIFSGLLTGSRVTISVGPDGVKWHLHEQLLCDTSSVFKAAFQSGFSESESMSMEFPEVDNEIFKNSLAGYTIPRQCWLCQRMTTPYYPS